MTEDRCWRELEKHWSEIDKLRRWRHDIAQLVTANTNDLEHIPDRVAALEATINRLRGMAVAVSLLAGTVGALIVKLVS